MLPLDETGRTPTYDLQEVQRLVGQGSLSCLITAAARIGARECGFLEDQLVQAVLELGPGNFYKTMQAEKRPGRWQDVYHSSFAGTELYIKLQISSDGEAVIVQFKKR